MKAKICSHLPPEQDHLRQRSKNPPVFLCDADCLPKKCLAEVILLWLAILVTTRCFFGVSNSAGWMLALYLACVTLAAFLNFTLWRMNPA